MRKEEILSLIEEDILQEENNVKASAKNGILNIGRLGGAPILIRPMELTELKKNK